MHQKNNDRLLWFIDRIGNRVYRNNYCSCSVCKHVYEHGIVIDDSNDAQYFYDNECSFTADGDPMKYFDTREEMLEFEASLKQ